MIGTVIPTRLVKARWAWSELTSPRFAKKYGSLGPDAVRLQGMANAGARFDSLSAPDVDILVSLIEKRQSGFMPAFNGIENFVCVAWTKQDLLASLTIPAMSPAKNRHIPYSEFIKNPPHIVDGKPEWSDPRVTADNWPNDQSFSQTEPAISIRVNGQNMLIDGYGRSVIYMRHGKDADVFMVWTPA